jgi:hypothetical protein
MLEDGPEVELEGLKVGLETATEVVGSATFQPLTETAAIKVGTRTADVVLSTPPEKEARYVMVWPDVKGDVQVPTALPGSPFWTS